MIGIYKITSPSNRIYIGQSINIEKRFSSYKNISQSILQIRLHRSFLKYGIDLHVFEIIEECLFDELNIRERYWQDYYNVINKGLNCRLTETYLLKRVTSEETKLKISISNTGKKRSKETCVKLGACNKGIKRSDEFKIRNKIMSQTRKRESIKIINTETGEIFHMNDIIKITGFTKSWINKMLRGDKKNTTIYQRIN